MSRVANIKIQLAGVNTAVQLHHLLKESFDLPSYYGCNWDAFWEVITDCVELPKVIEFRGWQELESVLPREANLLKECLMELQQEYPEKASEVIYA